MHPFAPLDPRILATFRALLAEASTCGETEPTAMTLSSVGADGRVSARTVLLKDVDARGFVFYSNTQSRKGRQLSENPRVSLLFHWKRLRLQVQVQIEGEVEAVSAAEADEYFATRPRESQIGAWASIQSSAMGARHELEARIEQFTAKFADAAVPRPPHWSGYRVRPDAIEFWYGAAHRLHERHQHRLADGNWRHTLLYP